MRLGEAIEAGMVGINRAIVSDPSAHFGGMKESDVGSEGAREGLDELRETQYFSVDWPWPSVQILRCLAARTTQS